MQFVLDCIEKVTEAASWVSPPLVMSITPSLIICSRTNRVSLQVWDKLRLGWNKLVEFAGFFFNWQDILDTKETIKGLMNAGLDYAADGIEGFNDTIERYSRPLSFTRERNANNLRF
jgi:hypothetical protein